MTLISITTVIPYFLVQLGASTFQLAIAASMVMVCNLVMQPFFGSIASRSHKMHRTFGKILLLQRTIFLAFIFSIPILIKTGSVFIWIFLFFWAVFNLFTGSYNVFFTPIMIKLLPPDKRGTARGIGTACGAVLGVGTAALIPLILGHIRFPFDYVLIFSLGIFFLYINAFQFLFMREHDDIEPRIPMSTARYIKEMPSSFIENKSFRSMTITFTFLLVANSLLSYYTLYAIRVFSVGESQIAALSALAVISGAVGSVVFGVLTDRHGPKFCSIIIAVLIIFAGGTALIFHSLYFLFAAWIFANLANSGYFLCVNLMIGEVSPPAKIPLHAGVFSIITMAVSSIVLMLLSQAIEKTGFAILFATVLSCGLLSLFLNMFVLRKQLN